MDEGSQVSCPVVEEDHPNRCQAITSAGQCRRLSISGAHLCAYHNGNVIARANQSKEMYRFQVAKAQANYKDYLSNPNWRRVQDELSVLRVLLQEKLEACDTGYKLAISSPHISDLVVKINNLILSATRLEREMKTLLAKEEILEIASRLVAIISEYVNDPKVLDEIAKRFECEVSSQQQFQNS